MPPQPSEPAPSHPETAAVLTAVQADLQTWRAAHPRATFAEIEAAVEASLGRLRAQLIAESLPVEVEPVGESAAPDARPNCPTCTVPLHPRGRRARTVRVVGDQPVTLRRHYWTGPACGDGLFPPG